MEEASAVMERRCRYGVVVIGRNEGERLQRCLKSLGTSGSTIVYVDSGSDDGSVDFATSLGVKVLELDTRRRFCAARARNEGFESLRENMPDVEFVQFVDGDCEIQPGWLDIALAFLIQTPSNAVVCGALRERQPEASLYNRLAQIEWDVAAGKVESCGGIFMVRAQAFAEIGGFDPTVFAGEEPEMCERIRAAGWSVWRLADPMASHDAAILRFRQWWTREIRSGRHSLEIATRFGHRPSQLYVKTVMQARYWGLGWPGFVLLSTLTSGLLGGWYWALMALCVSTAILPLQMLRVGIRTWRAGYEPRTALAYGALVMIAKFAHLTGQAIYYRDALAKREPSLIEYKGAE